MKENGKLSELPASGEEWEKVLGGEQVKVKPEPINQPCEHYFRLVSGREAQCQNCNWGLFLGAGDEIRDGHLYVNDERIV